MRDAERQTEFLEHGRFGEGEETLAGTRVDRWLWTGLLFLLAAGIILGFAIILKLGRDDGGPFFIMGFIAFVAVGVLLCIGGLVRMRSK